MSDKIKNRLEEFQLPVSFVVPPPCQREIWLLLDLKL